MDPACLACKDLIFERPGKKRVLNGLDVTFSAAAPVLIDGPTGAGKSTLIHLLAGILKPTSGEIRAADQPVSRFQAAQLDHWRRDVGLVFQQLHLLIDLTVLENVLLPCIPGQSGWSVLIRRADALLDRLDLTDLRDQPVKRLSGGQRQRAAIARALIVEPRYLLMDEPTSFQDDDHTQTLLALVTAEAARGACVVVSSHDNRLLQAVKIFRARFFLNNGRLEALP